MVVSKNVRADYLYT